MAQWSRYRPRGRVSGPRRLGAKTGFFEARHMCAMGTLFANAGDSKGETFTYAEAQYLSIGQKAGRFIS